jgi:DNA repair protein RadA/Sms
MLIAVTERAAKLKLWDKDVYIATVAGAKVSDTGADLALCLAVLSAARDVAVPRDLTAIGEVALSGDVRPVPGMAQRVAEAARLGFTTVLIAKGSGAGIKVKGVRVVEVSDLAHAIRGLKNLESA